MGFFSNGDFPSRICCDVFKTALFSEKLLLHTSSEWPLRQSRRATFSNQFCTTSNLKSYVLEKANFSKKAIFCITYFFWRAAVLEQLLFQMTLPSMVATFSETLLVHNILFRKSYYFTDRFPFHSNTSYLSFGN